MGFVTKKGQEGACTAVSNCPTVSLRKFYLLDLSDWQRTSLEPSAASYAWNRIPHCTLSSCSYASKWLAMQNKNLSCTFNYQQSSLRCWFEPMKFLAAQSQKSQGPIPPLCTILTMKANWDFLDSTDTESDLQQQMREGFLVAAPPCRLPFP